MVSSDFIDLLSSDEDAVLAPSAPKPAPRLPAKPVEKSVASHSERCSESRLLHLNDDFEINVLLDGDFTSKSVKRRKLNVQTYTEASSWTNDGYALLSDDEPPIVISPARPLAKSPDFRWRASGIDERDAPSEDPYDSLPENILGLSRQTTSRHLDTVDLSIEKATVIRGLRGQSSTLSDTTKAVLAGLTNGRADNCHTSEAIIRTTSIAAENDAWLHPVDNTRNTNEIDEREETDQLTSGKLGKRKQLTKEEKALRDVEKAGAKLAKAQDRQRSREGKAKEKEEHLTQKRLDKEEKAKQKQKDAEIAEVNKAKLDKKDSTPEMIVDLPASIDGDRVDTQTREFLKNLDVEASQYQSLIPNVIRWRRKVKAKYNPEEGLWEPLSRLQIEDEKHVMCIMPAKEFISLATNQDVEDGLDIHVAKLKRAYPDCVPIYLIEGLTKRIRESKTAANRTYQNKVLSQGQTESTSGTSSQTQTNKRKKTTAAPLIIDEDTIEDALLRLQVTHGTLIHHTSFYTETAEWIATFTQHISTIPYKHARMNLFSLPDNLLTKTNKDSNSGHAGNTITFCMDPGQVKTGADKEDTYSKMLQSVVRVTPAIALAIVDEYPSVIKLVRAFRAEGPLVLQDVRKVSVRGDGGVVGQALSRRLHGIFMGEDPESVKV